MWTEKKLKKYQFLSTALLKLLSTKKYPALVLELLGVRYNMGAILPEQFSVVDETMWG